MIEGNMIEAEESKTMADPSIRKEYDYHKPTDSQLERIAQLRQSFSALQDEVNRLVSNGSRYKSLASTALEESAMWAVKAVVLG